MQAFPPHGYSSEKCSIMEYNDEVEVFRDIEYPMLKGKPELFCEQSQLDGIVDRQDLSWHGWYNGLRKIANWVFCRQDDFKPLRKSALDLWAGTTIWSDYRLSSRRGFEFLRGRPGAFWPHIYCECHGCYQTCGRQLQGSCHVKFNPRDILVWLPCRCT